MRKQIAIILFLTFILKGGYSQVFEGKYCSTEDYIGFNKDYIYFNETFVEFSFGSEGGLIIPMKGIGEYRVFYDYLVINTLTFNEAKTRYYSKEKIEDIIENRTIAFRIISKEKDQLTLMLLPSGTIGKIYTVYTLKELEKTAKKKLFRIREFKK